MNPVAQLFEKFSPYFFSYLCRLKEAGSFEIPPFLFHGPLYSGKEWTAIKTAQFLNCPDFLQENHHPLFCKSCFRINTLSMSDGILVFMSALPLDHLQPALIAELANLHEQTDPLMKENLIREISKIELFLEAQVIKERGGGPKKLGLSKSQGFGEQLALLRRDIVKGSVEKTQKKEFEALLAEISTINTDMGLDFLKHLIKKLQFSPLHTSSYRVLLLKDPALLKNQSLILNTLLKTIEDPKIHFTTFLLTQKKNHILPTIRSRMNFLSFAPFSQAYKDYLKQEFPHYSPLASFSPERSSPSLSEIQKAPAFKQKPLILEYLEKKKASYIGISPLLLEKRRNIQNFIVGIREYNLSLKNVLEILSDL